MWKDGIFVSTAFILGDRSVGQFTALRNLLSNATSRDKRRDIRCQFLPLCAWVWHPENLDISYIVLYQCLKAEQ